VTARRTTDAPAGIPARWPGTCCICKEWFPKDTRIAKQRGNPCHVECHQREHE
jgi:hypothetical protein